MTIFMIVTAMLLLDALALKYGADSRDTIDREHRVVGLLS